MAPKKQKRGQKDAEADVAGSSKQPTIEELDSGQRTVVDKFGQSEATQITYANYLKNGRAFLADIVKSAKESNEGFANIRSDEPVSIGTLLHDPKFAAAFEDTPNEHSPRALVLFISQKCVHEAKGIGTAHGIRSAFKKHWDKIDDGVYRDKWQQDPITKLWKGNPAKAAGVTDLMSALKHKQGAEGDTRHHSRAMRFEHMQKIISWSESVCPSLKELGTMNSERIQLAVKHLRLRAFITTAFTIWTRNDELIQLKRSDIEFDCKGPPPYFEDHFRIHLSNRKGWQRKLDNDDLDTRRNVFGIYNQPDKHPINCYFHLKEYLYLHETYYYNLEPNDYIFPVLSRNGTIQRGEHISAAIVQFMIDEAVDKAQIGVMQKFRFTTHCFRRGGAQYRFMHAPFGERWPMDWIRGWGGWAEKESSDTLIKYLIDDLQAAEQSHTDILYKIRPDFTKSLMSEHSQLEAATNGEVQSAYCALKQQIDQAQQQIIVLQQQVRSGFTAIMQQMAGQNNGAQNYSAQLEHQNLLLPNAISSTSPSPAQFLNNQHTPLSTPALSSLSVPLCIAPSALQKPPAPVSNQPPAPKTVPKPPEETPPGLCIPRIPLKGRSKVHSLEDIIDQWENPNGALGLTKALKDWPLEWYTTGDNRKKFNAKREQRKRIAVEYIEHFQRDDAAFKRTYPDWMKGHSNLYTAIKIERKRRKEEAQRAARAAAANPNADPNADIVMTEGQGSDDDADEE